MIIYFVPELVNFHNSFPRPINLFLYMRYMEEMETNLVGLHTLPLIINYGLANIRKSYHNMARCISEYLAYVKDAKT